MMKKKYMFIILAAVSSITAVLIVLGILYDQSELEKRQGMSDIFDVSADGMIAYIAYDEGRPGIYLKNNKHEPKNPALELDNDKEIIDVAFSPDGATLVFIESDKNTSSYLRSSVHLLQTKTLDTKSLFATKGLVTEIAFNPKEENQLFYLKAQSFENYSPIASSRPHEFDLYSYQIHEDRHEQHTNFKHYAMDSLQVSHSSKAVYVQMLDDCEAETADDIFEAKQKIFEIPLDDAEEMSVFSENEFDDDIYDFAVVPETEKIIFQAVAKEGGDGIFEYELFSVNLVDHEMKQLTYLKDHAGKPVIVKDQIYFIVDKQFGSEHPDYHLYRMDFDGEDIEKIILDPI